MPYPFDLIMFDLDGTLLETAGEIGAAVNDTLHDQGLPPVSPQQVRDWIGHGARELLLQALAYGRQTSVASVRADAGLAEITAAFERHYLQRCGSASQLYPHVRATLDALRQRGVKLAVVTNKEGRHTQALLLAHQLTPLLDIVISGDSLPSKKPDPAGIQYCLAHCAVPPGRALFVGDSCIDVATARNAGVPVWAVPYGYNQGQPIADCQPDRVIADCSALLEEWP